MMMLACLCSVPFYSFILLQKQEHGNAIWTIKLTGGFNGEVWLETICVNHLKVLFSHINHIFSKFYLVQKHYVPTSADQAFLDNRCTPRWNYNLELYLNSTVTKQFPPQSVIIYDFIVKVNILKRFIH